MIRRRSVTITEQNYDFICKQRGKAICSLHDIDFTTTMNIMLDYARKNGFDISKVNLKDGSES